MGHDLRYVHEYLVNHMIFFLTGRAGIGGALFIEKRENLVVFSGPIGIKESNRAEVWAIEEAF